MTTKHNAPWTDADDEFLRNTMTHRISDVAGHLGRTYAAVSTRRNYIRRADADTTPLVLDAEFLEPEELTFDTSPRSGLIKRILRFVVGGYK